MVLGACQPDEGAQNRATGHVQLRLSSPSSVSNSGRISDEVLSQVIISLETPSGEMILTSEKVDISKFGEGYVSSPVILPVGSYEITEFLVVNTNNEVVYATPISGSALAGLVSSPLPVDFMVLPNEVSEVSLEVIATNSYDPEDLGYSSFNFWVVPTRDILVSVLSQDAERAYSFAKSELTAYGGSDSLYTISLGDSINLITLPTEYDTFDLTFRIVTGR